MTKELTRYGLEWTGPTNFIPRPMDDGYWTPWHEAQKRIAELERERIDSQAQLMVERRELLEKLAEAQATIQQMREAAGKLDGIKSFLLGYETSEDARRNNLQPTVSRWIDGVSGLYRMSDAEADRTALDAMLAEAEKRGMLKAAGICLAVNANSNEFERPNGVSCADAIRQAAERSADNAKVSRGETTPDETDAGSTSARPTC